MVEAEGFFTLVLVCVVTSFTCLWYGLRAAQRIIVVRHQLKLPVWLFTSDRVRRLSCSRWLRCCYLPAGAFAFDDVWRKWNRSMAVMPSGVENGPSRCCDAVFFSRRCGWIPGDLFQSSLALRSIPCRAYGIFCHTDPVAIAAGFY